MLLTASALISVLYIQVISALPSQTSYANTTKTALLPGPAPTCKTNCTVGAEQYRYIYWQRNAVNTTITAATVVLVVNKKTNATRTTTIYNTDLGGYTTPTDINSAGTKVTTYVQPDPVAKTNSSIIITFPTLYTDYPYSFRWSGVVSSTASGTATCLTHNSFADELLPSHLTFPATVQSLSRSSSPEVPDDSRGWTYDAHIDYSGENPIYWLSPLFPDVAALSNCTTERARFAAPASMSQIAFFLTETSTSHEMNDASSTSAVTKSAAQVTSAASSSKPASVSVPKEGTTSSGFTGGTALSSPAIPSKPPQSNAPLSSPLQSNQPQSDHSPSNLPPLNPATPSPAPPADPVALNSPPSSDTPVAPLASSTPIPTAPLITTPTPAVFTSAPTSAPQNPFSNQPAQSIVVGSTVLPISTVAISTVISGTATTVLGIAIGTQTTPIGSTIKVFNTPVVVITSSSFTQIIIGPSTHPLFSAPLPAPTAVPAPIVIGSNTITANSASQYIVSDQTLAAGSMITLGFDTSTTVIALQTSNSETQLVVGGTTTVLPKYSAPALVAAPAPLTINGQTVTANSAAHYILSGQTLAPGSTITLGSGATKTLIALQTTAGTTNLVIGDSTSALPPPSTLVPDLSAPAIRASSTDTDSGSQYVITSQTLLLDGSAVTVSGTTISLAPSGSFVTINGNTFTLLPPSPPTASQPAVITALPIVNIGSATLAVNSLIQHVSAGQTLTADGAVRTVSSTWIVLAPVWSAVSATGTAGVGGYICSGIGGTTGNATASGTGVVPFTGGASSAGGRKRGGLWAMAIGMVGLSMIVGCL